MFVMTLVSLVASASFAALQDLSLPGEKWVATFDKYICAAFGEASRVVVASAAGLIPSVERRD